MLLQLIVRDYAQNMYNIFQTMLVDFFFEYRCFITEPFADDSKLKRYFLPVFPVKSGKAFDSLVYIPIVQWADV